jgi:hypothetical protein
MTLPRIIFTGAHWGNFRHAPAREGSRTKIARCTRATPASTLINSGKLLEKRSVYRSTISQRLAPSPYRPSLNRSLRPRSHAPAASTPRTDPRTPGSPQHLVKRDPGDAAHHRDRNHDLTAIYARLTSHAPIVARVVASDRSSRWQRRALQWYLPRRYVIPLLIIRVQNVAA